MDTTNGGTEIGGIAGEVSSAAPRRSLESLRRKPKELPVPTVDQKAAHGKAVAGLAREECFNRARADALLEDQGVDNDETEAIMQRQGQEREHQALPWAFLWQSCGFAS